MIFPIRTIRSIGTFGRQGINLKGTWETDLNHSLQSI